jgi:hypothetical protein
MAIARMADENPAVDNRTLECRRCVRLRGDGDDDDDDGRRALRFVRRR